MKREGYYVIRTIIAGQIGEKIKYWVPGQKPTKSVRKMKSDLRKIQQNEVDAVKRVARLINANFLPGDCFFAPTYSDESIAILMAGMPEGLSEDEQMDYVYAQAHHQLQLYLRRVRRACDKAGIEFKYIAITSDMDGETGESVRVHHHIIAPRAVMEILLEKWTLGMVRKNYVWNEPDHYGLAKYLMDQVRRIPDAKKYIPSRNLIIPVPKDRIAPSGKEVQPPKGATLLHRSEYSSGRPQYIRYIIPKKPKPGGGDDPDAEIGGAS